MDKETKAAIEDSIDEMEKSRVLDQAHDDQAENTDNDDAAAEEEGEASQRKVSIK